MTRCSFCGKNIEGLPYNCHRCNGSHCSKHRLPEDHNCFGLEGKNVKNQERWNRALRDYSHKNRNEQELTNNYRKPNLLKKLYYKIRYWLNYKTERDYRYSRLESYVFPVIIKLIVSLIIAILLYSNLSRLNEIKFWIIKLGSSLFILDLFFLVRYSFEILNEIWNWIKRQRNWLKYLIIIIFLILLWQSYVNRTTVLNPFFDYYNKTNFSVFSPLNLSSINFTKLGDKSNEFFKDSGVSNMGCSVIQIEYNYPSSEEDSKKAIDYINEIRKEDGKKPISFDKRVFELAVARAKDMRDYNYLDHTNPTTGSCPDNMKISYGLNSNEFVAENAFGNPIYSEGSCTEIEERPMIEAIDSWMTSRGHRYNLLFDEHVAGAVGCYKNMCTFLGLNYERFGEGCHTATEGISFWNSAEKQPGEV